MLVATAIIIKALFCTSALLLIGLSVHKAMSIYQFQKAVFIAAAAFIILAILRLVQLNANAGGGWSQAFSADTFTWIWMANKRQYYAFIAGALMVLIGAAIKRPQLGRASLMLGAVITAVGFGLAGHTQGLEKPGIMPILTMGHVLIAGFWMSAIISLFPTVSIETGPLVDRVKRFSRIAIYIIPILFISGVWLLWTLSGSFTSIFTQSYGRILLAKLVIAGILMMIGAYNKLIVTKQLESFPDHGRKLLAKTLLAEATLFFVVIILISTATTLIGPNHGA